MMSFTVYQPGHVYTCISHVMMTNCQRLQMANINLVGSLEDGPDRDGHTPGDGPLAGLLGVALERKAGQHLSNGSNTGAHVDAYSHC